METPKKKLLSTSSPEGLSVAARITSTRIANLLIRKGPLPIRHITGQLALEVQGFEMLSLSKQRRLIMAAMEQVDPENNVLFEKIGWGQWAVRKVDSDYIVTEGTEGSPVQAMQDDDMNKKLLSIHDLRNQTGVKLGWTKKSQPQNGAQMSPTQMSPPNGQFQVPTTALPPIQHRRKSSNSNITNLQAAAALRRESISATRQNLHNIKLPNESSLKNDSASISTAIESDSDDDLEDDYAVADEMDESDSETDIESDEAVVTEEGTMFSFDDDVAAGQVNSGSIAKFKPRAASASAAYSKSRRRSSMKSPPPGAIKFANRVPLKVSPPPGAPRDSSIGGSTGRRKSSSSTPGVSKYNYCQRHQIFNRSRLNSFENLDNYIVSSAKSSGTSLSSPPPPNHYQQQPLAGPTGSFSLSSSPWNSNYIHNASPENISIAATISSIGRRKSSFNESHIRSTLSSSLPKPTLPVPSSTTITSTSTLPKPYESQSHAKSSNSVYNNKSLTRHHLTAEHSDTDEEDWATIGAESLRNGNGDSRHRNTSNSTTTNPGIVHQNGQSLSPSQAEERNAAYALVDLMSV